MKLTSTNRVLINSILIVAEQIGYPITFAEVEQMSRQKATDLYYRLRIKRG